MQTSITLDSDNNLVNFITDGASICRIEYPSTEQYESSDEGIQHLHQTDRWEILDRIRQEDSTKYTWRRTWKNCTSTRRASALSLELEPAFNPTWSMIPAISYNGNEWGAGNEPKGFEEDGAPWTFASHRSTIPSATYTEGEEWAVSLFADDAEPSVTGACAFVPHNGTLVHRLLWPDIEQPMSYTSRNEYGPAQEGTIEVDPGEAFTAEVHLILHEVTDPRTSWRETVDRAWELFDSNVQAQYEPVRVWDLGLTFAHDGLWTDSEEFTGFSASMAYNGEWLPSIEYPFKKAEIGFQGQNAALATAFLQDYAWNGNERHC